MNGLQWFLKNKLKNKITKLVNFKVYNIVLTLFDKEHIICFREN
ncbi:hypothetical protein CNEO2_40080 [Clostridium neonatale]|nr:hypothetical protein CNEO2_220081 [Clostridium neonatale]CAI3203307.1 hypothetical protein CNEO2_270081 [Clostridium neonatale]CAI3222031.1 hypothetical protein CNEO2_120011 [Clostridium neonatale]CAI3242976.1 hypothetical protein CNEO2_40080 [Clostridium neonatale]CAI3589277.1 hypothetical protein CNEO4_200203 [Clostridium neonatale]